MRRVVALLPTVALAVAGLALLAASTSAAADTTGPVVSNVVVAPTTVSAGATITVEFDVADPSGLQPGTAQAIWQRDGGTQHLVVNCSSEGNPVSHHCSGSIPVTALTAAGTYSPVWLVAWDALANQSDSVGLLPAITVTGGTGDTTGPVVTNLIVAPTTASAGATITVEFDVADPSGLQPGTAQAIWQRDGGTQHLVVNCSSQGNRVSHHCSGSIPVTALTAAGTYSPVWLLAWDALANQSDSVGLMPAITVVGGMSPTPTPSPATPLFTPTPSQPVSQTPTPGPVPSISPSGSPNATHTTSATPSPTTSPTPAPPAPSPELPLAPGSNLVAWPGSDISVAAAIAVMPGAVQAVYEWDPISRSWWRYFPGGPAFVNNLVTLRTGHVYWVIAN